MWLASHLGDAGSISEQFLWYLWWTQCHWGKFFFECFVLLSLIIMPLSILMYHWLVNRPSWDIALVPFILWFIFISYTIHHHQNHQICCNLAWFHIFIWKLSLMSYKKGTNLTSTLSGQSIISFCSCWEWALCFPNKLSFSFWSLKVIMYTPIKWN
jgi:hypothetical protein